MDEILRHRRPAARWIGEDPLATLNIAAHFDEQRIPGAPVLRHDAAKTMTNRMWKAPILRLGPGRMLGTRALANGSIVYYYGRPAGDNVHLHVSISRDHPEHGPESFNYHATVPKAEASNYIPAAWAERIGS